MSTCTQPRRQPGTTLTILLTDSDEIRRIVRDIRGAAKASRWSGGGYTVILHHAKDPARRCFLEVCLGGEDRRKREADKANGKPDAIEEPADETADQEAD